LNNSIDDCVSRFFKVSLMDLNVEVTIKFKICQKHLKLLNFNFSTAFIIFAALSLTIKDIFDSILYSQMIFLIHLDIYFLHYGHQENDEQPN
jgi:hypothetical protein